VEQGDFRAARLAANEAAVRLGNEERVKPDEELWMVGSRRLELDCECAIAGCNARIVLTYREYGEVRRDAAMFLVVHGHELPDVEEVVARSDAFLVVRKLGLAKRIAEETDPRS
jgi:hypothetical protein